MSEFDGEQVNVVASILKDVYEGYIPLEAVFSPNEDGTYKISKKALNTALKIIDILHIFNPKEGITPNIPIDFAVSLNKEMEVVLSGTSKDAENNNVSNSKVKTPFTAAFNNSSKIPTVAKETLMFSTKEATTDVMIKESFVDTFAMEENIEDILAIMEEENLYLLTDENLVPCVPLAEDGMRGNDFTKGSKWKMIEEFDGATHSEGGIDIKLTDRGFTFAREDGDVLAENGLLIAKK